MNNLKAVLHADHQTQSYLARINTVSSLTHWNEFKFSFSGLFTGIHSALTAASTIPQHYGFFQFLPKFLNPCYLLSGLFAWRFLSCIVTHAYHKCKIKIDTSKWSLWKSIPYGLGIIIVAGPEYMHYGFYDRFLNWALQVDKDKGAMPDEPLQ